MPATQCPTDEVLALFAVSGLDAAKQREVLAHLEGCSECMTSVLSASAFMKEEAEAASPRSASRWWIAAIAAAAVIAIVMVPLLLRRPDPVAKLAAVAPASQRDVEARLSGFAWAPYRGAERATGSPADAARLKLGGAAAAAIQQAQGDRSAPAQHAAGVALVLVGRPDEAIERLRVIAEGSPDDARAWNDLAAARYAAAVQLGQSSVLPAALGDADHALRVAPRSAEALFNRALIIERMGRADEARAAWRRYLDADPSSPWAAEARSHLRDLS